MTAKVLEFRRRPSASTEVSAKVGPARRLITTNEIFADCFEELIGRWQTAAAKNALNEFVREQLPKHARSSDPDADYINDLNVIAAVERRLAAKVAVFYPGTTSANAYGWMAVFHRGHEVFSTPADMASEASARALNLLLMLSLERRLGQLG